MSKVFAFLADGLEEVECLAVVDVLRRAGAEVTLVSVTGSREITGSHHIHFQADALFDETAAEEADVLFLPGGMPGTNTLKAHEGLKNAICKANKQGRRIAAICAHALMNGYEQQEAIDYVVAASCLKHSIEHDYNLVSEKEVKALAGGNASGRVQR